ncbi:MAG TPA: EAL domain-containing protein, partial [Frankiaceae bacterium]|nr:EAL domain-containing protein [Frankiaceae bacterium]
MDVRLHPQEADRLASLASYRVLDSEPDDTFDALTRLAALICEAPISRISLVAADRQWFLSRYGFDAMETSRSDSVASDAVATGNSLVDGDLASTPRYADLASSSGLAAYAGVPLIGRDGLPLGALCVLDIIPRTFTPDQLSALADLAAQTVTALELRRCDATSGLDSNALVPEARLPVTLRAALDDGEFVPHFQPIIDMRDGSVRGLEALVRWAHPTRGLLSPATFLPGLETGT